MKVTVIGGTGYIGLVTGLGLAVHGNEVICVDIDQTKIDGLKQDILPIYERGLDELLAEAKELATITFTTAAEFAIRQSDIIMIAVGTPAMASGATDMRQITTALKQVAQAIDRYKVIVIKSTVPVGTGAWAKQLIKQHLKKPGVAFDVVSNPEFLREGKAVKDFLHPERIVIGADTKRATGMIKTLYHTFDAPLITTDITSSEMIKYACNAYLATRLSYINEIAEISECVGADIHSVIAGMSYDNRIGGHYLNPGPGFGGPCLNKDINALIHFAQQAGADVNLLRAVLSRNARQTKNISHYVSQQIQALGIANENVNICLLGLSFKAGTDDLRNSPAVDLIDQLVEKGVVIKAYDPAVKALYKRHATTVSVCDDLFSAVDQAHIIIIMTEWPQFKQLDLNALKKRIKYPLIVDTRNIINVHRAQLAGFVYKGIGIADRSALEIMDAAL